MKRLRFYREETNRWYVDIPEWEGSKSDLEMVAGADTMLEYFSEGEDSVWLYISDEYFENSDYLSFQRMADEIGNGAFYVMKKYRGIELNLDLWLCDVTLFVLGKFPEKIYLSKSNY
jgi:hypothetical protein